MLAARLFSTVSRVLGEYAELQVIGLLQEAQSLAANRPTMNDRDYANSANNIRSKADVIKSNTIVPKLPRDLRRMLEASGYATALPGSIADVILKGFPNDKGSAISSGEVGLYLQLAHTFLSELGTMQLAGNKLKIEGITIPNGLIAVDILLPRPVFGNGSIEYVELVEKFLSIISYIEEVVTGTKSDPKLVYTSTSDPIISVAAAAGTVWAFLQYYKLILEVAEKQINLVKTLRTLRGAGVAKPEADNFEQRMREIANQEVEAAIAKVIPEEGAHVPPARVSEVRVAVSKASVLVLDAVSNGARISLTVESLERSNALEEASGLEGVQLNERLAEQMRLENQVGVALDLLGEPARAVLIAPQSPNNQ
jgi:hypothetical protein